MLKTLKRIASFSVIASMVSIVGMQTPVSANYAPLIGLTGDTYVAQAYPTHNYGSSQKLWVDTDPVTGNLVSYLQFDVRDAVLESGNTACDIGSYDAWLYLRVAETSNGGHELYEATTSTYTQNNITYNNVPTIVNEQYGPISYPPEAYEEDSLNDTTQFNFSGSVITNACQNSGGIVTLAIKGGTDNAVAWWSSNASNPAYRPTVKIDIGD